MNAVVVGGGVAGLVAAHELMLQGETVTLLEASDRLGGMVQGVLLAGMAVDAGAEAYATRTPVVRDLCRALGLDVAAPSGRSHVFWAHPPRTLPLAQGLLGIPSSLDDEALTLALDADELRRAREDLTAPVGAIGGTVADLVNDRLGPAVVERLVAPLTRGVFSREPDQLSLDQYAPGLAEATRREGSLVRAVAALSQDRPGTEQPVGGMHMLITALASSLADGGATVMTNVAATKLLRSDAQWCVTTTDGSLSAERVVVATPARPAQALLAGAGVDFEPPGTHVTRSVLLALRHPGLDGAPVGTGLLLAERPAGVVAKSLTHYSAKWPWATSDHVHVVRLAWPAEDEPSLAQAMSDAGVLLGLDLREHHLVDHHVAVWEDMPQVMPAADRERLLADLAATAGLSVAGAWLAGNGLAAVVGAAKAATS